MPDLSFHDADAAHVDFQYLEDLSTAYWYSEILFAAIELGLFDFLEKGISDLDALAASASCRKNALHRLLKTMERLTLVCQEDGRWFNSQIARMYLIQGQASYMGDFLLYRKYMQPRWQALVQKVSLKKDRGSHVCEEDDYALRTLNYVKATDALIRRKSDEMVGLLKPIDWQLPVLDLGGGAGSLCRALIRSKMTGGNPPCGDKRFGSVLFELPEVIEAAKHLYCEQTHWEHMQTIGGDFRSHEFEANQRFGLIVLSNFIHAYGAQDARVLLNKATGLLKSDGIMLIHDYFPDRCGGRSPQKGTLYDLNMMLNTFDGACHESATVIKWLKEAELGRIHLRDMTTDTSIIVASGESSLEDVNLECHESASLQEWVYAALGEGFQRAVLLQAEEVVTGVWVRNKCRFGCEEYGQNLKCPPYGMDRHETQQMLSSYSWALVLEGMPPGRAFHDKLLALEKKAFLAGFHKAFAFGAGPCPVCSQCPEDNVCRYPGLARPAMEASGIDVYATAKAAGINLKPITEKGRYVKYMGLLLLK